MDALGVVEQGDVDIGVKGLDLIEIKGRENRPCLQRKVAWVLMMTCSCFFRLAKNLFEHRAPERIQPADGKVQNPAGGDVGRFLVHHLPDVEHGQVVAGFAGEFLHFF